LGSKERLGTVTLCCGEAGRIIVSGVGILSSRGSASLGDGGRIITVSSRRGDSLGDSLIGDVLGDSLIGDTLGDTLGEALGDSLIGDVLGDSRIGEVLGDSRGGDMCGGEFLPIGTPSIRLRTKAGSNGIGCKVDLSICPTPSTIMGVVSRGDKGRILLLCSD
jgi:hypothetical protein